MEEQKQVKFKVDESEMIRSYANAFRTNQTPEELVLDFGFNLTTQEEATKETNMTFKIDNRVVLNYYSAKRLAISIGQALRAHEEQFGEIEVESAKRSL